MMDEENSQNQPPKGWQAVQSTGSNFCKNFTEGTSRIADDILDKNISDKKEKLKKVRETSWVFVKGLLLGLQNDLKKIGVGELMGDMSYEAGRLSAISKNRVAQMWGQAMDKLDEDKIKG